MTTSLWEACFAQLQRELTSQQFNTWIRPLHVIDDAQEICLLAPNRYVKDWINERFLTRITEILSEISQHPPSLRIEVGMSKPAEAPQQATTHRPSAFIEPPSAQLKNATLNPNYTFDTFVEGKSNQLARAASLQIAQNPGKAYNPLFLYGGVGLGKTHLMHAVGHMITQSHPQAKVVYLHSERFVADMVKALQHNTIDAFKRYYRSVDALLIDDIQFFAGKERSQEEFFHTFNALLEGQQQIILTCDRYPKEVDGLEERLKSRFGWGLTVSIEPPELETRVAILMNKALQSSVALPDEVAFFIAKRIRSNIRELEGALRRVAANAQFTAKPITLEFAKEALRDLIALQDKLVTIENIIKVVAEYYKIRVADILLNVVHDHWLARVNLLWLCVKNSPTIAYQRSVMLLVAETTQPFFTLAAKLLSYASRISACLKIMQI